MAHFSIASQTGLTLVTLNGSCIHTLLFGVLLVCLWHHHGVLAEPACPPPPHCWAHGDAHCPGLGFGNCDG